MHSCWEIDLFSLFSTEGGDVRLFQLTMRSPRFGFVLLRCTIVAQQGYVADYPWLKKAWLIRHRELLLRHHVIINCDDRKQKEKGCKQSFSNHFNRSSPLSAAMRARTRMIKMLTARFRRVNSGNSMTGQKLESTESLKTGLEVPTFRTVFSNPLCSWKEYS